MDGNVGDSSAAPAFEPRNSTDVFEPDKDTLYMSFQFMEGIILASYSHKTTGAPKPKFVEINSHTLSTMVDRTVDETFHKECQRLGLQNNPAMSPLLAAECLESILDKYKDNAAALIAGWEPNMGPALFTVDNNEEGCLGGFKFSVRSGFSTIVSGPNRFYEMSICEAVSSAQFVMRRAAFKEGARDGYISVYYVGRNGWKKMLGYNVVKQYCYPATRNTGDQEIAQAP